MTAVSTSDDALVVASCDSHVSPPMSYLRPYCEQRYLDDFDAFTKDLHEKLDQAGGLGMFANRARDKNMQEMERRPEYRQTDYSDPNVRIDRMNHERISLEVVFHGTSQVTIVQLESLAPRAGCHRDVFGLRCVLGRRRR